RDLVFQIDFRSLKFRIRYKGIRIVDRIRRTLNPRDVGEKAARTNADTGAHRVDLVVEVDLVAEGVSLNGVTCPYPKDIVSEFSSEAQVGNRLVCRPNGFVFRRIGDA